MDGVVTDTATLHRQAWKRMFDTFLAERAPSSRERLEPFTEDDYLEYVDGLPRYEGAQAFLCSRGIDLPWGDATDPAGAPTVCGLGNRKNELFSQLLEGGEVKVFDDAVACLHRLREAGYLLASATASENGPRILAATGLTDLFDIRVDGNTIRELGLPQKRDLFVEAARRLGVAPASSCVIEDARPGVEEAVAGGFGLVVGLDRHGDGGELGLAGADWVLSSLDGFDPTHVPPSALGEFEVLAEELGERTPALFLDYDGTLSPIVEDPEAAVLSPAARDTLRELAQLCPLAVVSGRDRADVQRRVDLPGLYYAGSHGFEITGPGHQHDLPEALRALPALDRVEQTLKQRTERLEGVFVERKRFAIAVHYRRAPSQAQDMLAPIVHEVVVDEPSIRMRGGKKIYEVQPDLPWDKGRAVLYLWDVLELDDSHVPFYIGDDTTDEDAFTALADRGICIRVGVPPSGTQAHWRLRNPDEVHQFLQRLTGYLRTHR